MDGVCQEQFLFIMKNHLNFCYLDDEKRSIIFRFSDTIYDKWGSRSILLSDSGKALESRGEFRVQIKVLESKKSYNLPCAYACHCLCMQTKSERNLPFTIRRNVNSLQTWTQNFSFHPWMKNFSFSFSCRKFCFVLTKTESQAGVRNDKWA